MSDRARPPVTVRVRPSEVRRPRPVPTGGGRPSQRRRASPTPPRLPAPITRSSTLAALWTGFGAAAVGCFTAVVAALLAWIPDAGATGSSASTVRAGVITFLAAQHGGTRLNGVTMHFVPLGLTLVALALCWRGTRVLYSVPIVRRDRRTQRVLRLGGLQLTAYVLTCAALAPFAVVGTSSAPAIGAVIGAVAVGGVGFGTGALRYTPLGRRLARSLPVAVFAGARAAAGAILVYLGAGALLAAAATARHAGRFLDLSRGLARGLSGLPVAVLDLLAAPNAALAGSAYLAGPGFAVGTHSTYGPFGGKAGLVPAFPVLAGLPTGPRASTIVLALLVATIAVAGIVAGVLVHRATRFDSWSALLGAALLAGVFAGVGLAALVGAAGGNLGEHNLRAVGASPVQVGLMVTVEVAVLALPAAVIARLVAGRVVDEPAQVAAPIRTAPPARSRPVHTPVEAPATEAATVETVEPATVEPDAAEPDAAEPDERRAAS